MNLSNWLTINWQIDINHLKMKQLYILNRYIIDSVDVNSHRLCDSVTLFIVISFFVKFLYCSLFLIIAHIRCLCVVCMCAYRLVGKQKQQLQFHLNLIPATMDGTFFVVEAFKLRSDSIHINQNQICFRFKQFNKF